MSEVTLLVNDRPFRVMCPDGQEEHIRTLAEDLSQRVKAIKEADKNMSDAQALVMVGLTLCDALHEADAQQDKKTQDATRAFAKEVSAVTTQLQKLTDTLPEDG